MSDIEDAFEDLINDSWTYVDTVSKVFLHETTKMVAEAWANEIITMLTTRNLLGLSERTIKRRTSRADNILGPDYPLLETGDWVTFIEFRIKQHDRYDDLEIGVFDESTQIGHTGTITPEYIAKISEYGFEELLIPARAPFTKSELAMQEKIDKIITESWRSLPSKLKNSEYTYSPHSLVGRIESTGFGFIFRWDS